MQKSCLTPPLPCQRDLGGSGLLQEGTPRACLSLVWDEQVGGLQAGPVD